MKRKKLLIITLIIAILLAVSSIGYIVYNKFIAKNDTEEKDTKQLSLTEEENENILGVFDWLITTNWGSNTEDGEGSEQFAYFTDDLSRTTAVFFSNSLEAIKTEIESGSGEATCYKLTDLNALSIKVFGQGINYDNIATDFGDEEWNCPSGYVGMETGFASGPREIKELKLNETTGFYTIEIIPNTDEYEELNAVYIFNFKIDSGVQLKNLKFEDLSNLSGEKAVK